MKNTALFTFFSLLLMLPEAGTTNVIYSNTAQGSTLPPTINVFTATVDDNDAYVDLAWAVDKNLAIPVNGGPYDQGVTLEILADGIEIEEAEVIFGNVAEVADTISGTYRHYIGPDQNRNYKLRVRKIGPGNELYGNVTPGETLPFQPPTAVGASDATRPDSIYLSWTNNSKLADKFRIYRDGQLIATIDGTTEVGAAVGYVDAFDFAGGNSLVNGQQYNYCIQVFSERFSQGYAQVCDNGSTFDIGFTASDGSPEQSVEMSWNDVSAFCDHLLLRRNGIQIATLPSDAVSYNDFSPIFGKNSLYSLILVNENTNRVEDTDFGSVPRNGYISGQVLTQEGFYPVQNVEVRPVIRRCC